MPRRALCLSILALMTLGLVPAEAEPIVIAPLDCAGPAGDPAPDTAAWRARDAANMYCAQERHLDFVQHPLAVAGSQSPNNDPYRVPSRWNNVRFRFESVTIGGLSAEVYRPCRTLAAAPSDCPSLPAGLERFAPPYPAVIIAHGGLSRKELHWWSSQPLAEAGYVVLAWKSSGTSPNVTEAQTMIDWLKQDPDVDSARIGIAGHSAGGVVVNNMLESPDLAAFVSWDRAQSSEIPSEVTPRRPILYFFADYNCQAVPVCQPAPTASPPPVDGPGTKGNDFMRVRAAGVDTMQIALRAALHLDFVPALLAGNRYTGSTVMHYTTAWFDRYLKGKLQGTESPAEKAARDAIAGDAFARLTATSFDSSADLHNIGQGFWDPLQAGTSGDPLYGGNVPYTIGGMPTADRMSFYYRSKCFLTVPGTSDRIAADDIRTNGCGA